MLSHLKALCAAKRNAWFFPPAARCNIVHIALWIHLRWPKRATAGIWSIFDTNAKKLSWITSEDHLLFATEMPSSHKLGPGVSKIAKVSLDPYLGTCLTEGELSMLQLPLAWTWISCPLPWQRPLGFSNLGTNEKVLVCTKCWSSSLPDEWNSPKRPDNWSLKWLDCYWHYIS